MLKTIYKLINVIYREKNTCTVYTVLQSRGKDKVLLLGFPGLQKIVWQSWTYYIISRQFS